MKKKKKKLGDEILKEYLKLLERAEQLCNKEKIKKLKKAVLWIKKNRNKLNIPDEDRPILLSKDITHIKYYEICTGNIENNEKLTDNPINPSIYNDLDENIDKKNQINITLNSIINRLKGEDNE